MHAINNPKVSIVIPVYNGSDFLSEAIDSALAQTYPNLEILVVNDGSDDRGATDRIAKSYGNKIRYFRKENGGVSSALNYGINKMTGQYFSWLSHDDLYHQDKITKQVDYIKKSGQSNIIVACNIKVLFQNGLEKKEFIHRNTFRYIDIFLATSASVGLNGCSLLIPKKALSESGGFDTKLPVTQDYDLWFRLRDVHRFVLLEDHLVISRRHDAQDSVKKRELCHNEGDKLHHDFLVQISQERFKLYFLENQQNIKHAWKNYLTYKRRGFNQTAAQLLLVFLQYYFDRGGSKFYKLFIREAHLGRNIKSFNKRPSLWLTTSSKEIIRRNYASWNSTQIFQFIKGYLAGNRSSDNENHSFPSKVWQSLKDDGWLFTVRRFIRKLI